MLIAVDQKERALKEPAAYSYILKFIGSDTLHCFNHHLGQLTKFFSCTLKGGGHGKKIFLFNSLLC